MAKDLPAHNSDVTVSRKLWCTLWVNCGMLALGKLDKRQKDHLERVIAWSRCKSSVCLLFVLSIRMLIHRTFGALHVCHPLRLGLDQFLTNSCKLSANICAVCSQVFRHEGIIVPPWRKASSMITKWLPRRSLDETPMGIKTSAFPTKMPAPRGDSRFRTALAPRDLIKAVREQAREQTANMPHLGNRGPRAGSAGAVMGFAMDGGDRKAPDWLFG